jgi:probable HAF family extracellular repeat protein
MTNPRRRRLVAGALALGAAMTAGTALGAPAHAATTSGIATAYKLTLIKEGSFADGPTDVFGINNNGEIFGTGELAGGQTNQWGFVLPAGASTATFLKLPSNAAMNGSFADPPFPEMINNNGDVVGQFISNSIDNGMHAIEWPGGITPTDLEPTIDKATGFDGNTDDTVANGINDHGLIVVALTDGSIADGFTVQGSTVTKLPGLPGGGGGGGTNSNPIAVNNNNLIVGSAVNSAGNEVAAKWQNGKITSLGGLPGSFQTEALAVNSAGLAVGASISATDFNEHAVEFVNGKVIDLNVPGETNNDAQAKAVNDSGVIVGGDGNGHAFAFANGQSVDLNTLIPAGSGVTLTIANGINNNGVIVGDATSSSGQVGFELTPVS